MNILELLQQNQMATGLVAAAMAGSTTYALKELPKKVFAALVQYSTTEYSIASDKSYERVICRKFADKQKVLFSSGKYSCTNMEEGMSKAVATMDNGRSFFVYKKTLVMCERVELLPTAAINGDHSMIRTLRFRFFTKNHNVMLSFMKEAVDSANEPRTEIYTMQSTPNGNNYVNQYTQSRNEMVLNGSMFEDIIADVDRFISNEDWYHNHNITYKRGYLLYGPPGTGKTSMAKTIAYHLKWDLFFMQLSSFTSDEGFMAAINRIPKNSVVVFEDIDSMGVGGTAIKSADHGNDIKVSKSALLNALDGACTPQNAIFILTTNHIEVLDDALLRPGRIDKQYKLDYLQPEAQIRLYHQFYNLELVPNEDPISPALMKSIFQGNIDDPVRAQQQISAISAES